MAKRYKSEDQSRIRITPTGRKVRIRMRPGHAVIGEGGKVWYEDVVHEATEEFAARLIRRQKAVEVDPDQPIAERMAEERRQRGEGKLEQ